MKVKPTTIVIAATLGAIAVWWFFFRRQPVYVGSSLPGTPDGIQPQPLVDASAIPTTTLGWPSPTTGLDVPVPSLSGFTLPEKEKLLA